MDKFLLWLLQNPLFWAGQGVVLGPYFFVRGFLMLRRKRLILNCPRSTARAAALGLVEVSGKAAGPYTLVSPLSQTECLYYRLVIKSDPTGELRKRVQELCCPLFLDDGTGRLMIYPRGAELQLPLVGELSNYEKLAISPLTPVTASESEFAQEYCIKPGDDIFVLGTLRENPWAKADPRREVSELSRVGPGFVSLGEADVMKHAAFPSLAGDAPAGADLPSAGAFDLHPPVILMRSRGPFVISTDSQRRVVAKLNWKSVLCIWGGPVAMLWGLWVILSAAGVLTNPLQ